MDQELRSTGVEALGAGASRRRLQATSAYLTARESVLRAGFESEIDWQESRAKRSFNEQDFLREAAWVILSSGMRESVVRRAFPHVEASFLAFSSATAIVLAAGKCISDALCHFNHQGKIEAIVAAAALVSEAGIEDVRRSLVTEGPTALCSLPYIGPVTCFHLAKNLGMPVAKADRHLARIASTLGYEDVGSLCVDVASVTEHAVPVVDLVFWRYATIDRTYQRALRQAAASVC